MENKKCFSSFESYLNTLEGFLVEQYSLVGDVLNRGGYYEGAFDVRLQKLRELRELKAKNDEIFARVH